MRVEDFDYFLPEELIAQVPLLDRSSSKLLVVDRKEGLLTHSHFYNIIDMIDENSVLVSCYSKEKIENKISLYSNNLLVNLLCSLPPHN